MGHEDGRTCSRDFGKSEKKDFQHEAKYQENKVHLAIQTMQLVHSCLEVGTG